MTQENWRQALGRLWRESDPIARIAIGFVLALQAPLAIILLNTTFVPYDVDNMVYFFMHVIERVRVGAPIYVPVSPGHASPVYTPLYMWLVGMISRMLGPSMVWARLVTLAGTALMCWVIASFTWRNTRHLLLTIAAPCFLLSTWAYAGLWVNLVDLNSLHAGLTMLGFFVLSRKITPARALLAGVLWSLGALTKQTGLAYMAAGCLFVFLHSRRLGVAALLVSAGLFAGVAAYLHVTTHGEFLKQTVLVQLNHPWVPERLWDETIRQCLLGWWGIMTVMTLISLVLLSGKEFWKTVLRPEYFMCAAGVAVNLLTQPKTGSGALQGLVAYSGLAVCGCTGLWQLAQRLPEAVRPRFMALLACLQVGILSLPAIREFPYRLLDRHDREAYDQVAQVFKAGRASFLYFGYISTTFGQPESGNFSDESTNWKDGRMVFKKPRELNQPFYDQEYDYVIMPTWVQQQDPTVQAVVENYKPIQKLPAHPRGVHGGNARWEKYVFKANRLMPQEPGPSPAPPATP